MGFSQKSVVDMINAGHKIDVSDLAILRWLVDFSHTDKMVKVVDGGKTYYWVNYQSVLDDLPILNIGRRMLAVRLQRMVDAGILCSSLKRNGGTFTLYGFGEKYESLIDQDILWDDKKIADGCEEIYTRGDNKFTTGVTIDLQTKYQSTNNTSTNNQSTNMSIGRKRRTPAFVPPTLQDVEEYAKSRNSNADPKRFWDYYNAGDWKDSEGKPVKSWKQKFITWESKQQKRGVTENDGKTDVRRAYSKSQLNVTRL